MPLEHAHDRDAVAARLAEGQRPSYVRDFVYGGIDGAVTTFAIVAGVVGAALSSKVILILGAANLLADGFSMAASNYSGTKAVIDDASRIREIEIKHIETVPDGEREEVRQLLARKGLEGDTLENAVMAISRNRETWIEFMLAEEYGLSPHQPSPIHAGLATFAAFLLCGFIPLLPFAFGFEHAFETSVAMTGVVFFLIGAAKSRWSLASWWRSGAETLVIGGGAAALAYLVGHLLSGMA